MAKEFTEVKDSGVRQEFATGSRRDTADGKGRYDLIPVHALRMVAQGRFDLLPHHALFRLARHYEHGSKKYGDHNWTKGQPLHRYLDSAIRHMYKVSEGLADEDHAAAGTWNILAYIETDYRISIGVLPGELYDLQPPILPASGGNGSGNSWKINTSVHGRRPFDRTQRSMSMHLNEAIAYAHGVLENPEDDSQAVESVWNMMAFIETEHLVSTGKLDKSFDDFSHRWQVEKSTPDIGDGV